MNETENLVQVDEIVTDDSEVTESKFKEVVGVGAIVGATIAAEKVAEKVVIPIGKKAVKFVKNKIDKITAKKDEDEPKNEAANDEAKNEEKK